MIIDQNFAIYITLNLLVCVFYMFRFIAFDIQKKTYKDLTIIDVIMVVLFPLIMFMVLSVLILGSTIDFFKNTKLYKFLTKPIFKNKEDK